MARLSMINALVLVAHGSRDPRAAPVTRALARIVGAVPAFLDHTAPSLGDALRLVAAAGHTEATVVPLLLTEAYHSRVDIPAVLAACEGAGAAASGLRSAAASGPRSAAASGPRSAATSGLRSAATREGVANSAGDRARLVTARLPLAVRCAPVLGPAPELIPALLRGVPRRCDALVLAAAGTRDATARSTVELVAAGLAEAAGVPCVVAYASAAAPTPGEAVAALRAGGARRVAVAAYFLAPGLLHDRAVRSALAAGAVSVSAPLGTAPELAALILTRAAAVPVSG